MKAKMEEKMSAYFNELDYWYKNQELVFPKKKFQNSGAIPNRKKVDIELYYTIIMRFKMIRNLSFIMPIFERPLLTENLFQHVRMRNI